MAIIKLFPQSGIAETKATVNLDNGYAPAGIDRAWPTRCYQATVIGTGALTATIAFYGSTDGINFSATPISTISLSGSTAVTDNFASGAAWPFVRCITSSITGTNATVVAWVSL